MTVKEREDSLLAWLGRYAWTVAWIALMTTGILIVDIIEVIQNIGG